MHFYKFFCQKVINKGSFSLVICPQRRMQHMQETLCTQEEWPPVPCVFIIMLKRHMCLQAGLGGQRNHAVRTLMSIMETCNQCWRRPTHTCRTTHANPDSCRWWVRVDSRSPPWWLMHTRVEPITLRLQSSRFSGLDPSVILCLLLGKVNKVFLSVLALH